MSDRIHGSRFRKRCRRYNTPGDAHFLTFSCFRREAFLSADRSRRWFIDALADARRKHGFDLWAYVVMPEHVHLVIYPRADDYSISAIFTDIKQRVTRAALRFVRARAPACLARTRDAQPNAKVPHRFWQRGGYDRNLLDLAEVFDKTQYLPENPVRRGLVSRPEDRVWSSARYYAQRSGGVLSPDVDSLPDMRLIGGKACSR